MVSRFFHFLCVLAFSIGTAQAGETVTISVPVSKQPYFIPIESEGLVHDTLAAVFATSGRQVLSFYVSSLDNTGILDRQEKVDCASYQPAEVAERWFAADQTHPLHDVVVTLASRRIQIDSADDLRNKKVLGFSGANRVLGADFREAVQSNPQYREVQNHRAQVRLLTANRVDAIIVDRLLVEWYLDYLEGGRDPVPEVVFHEIFPESRLWFVCRTQELVDEYIRGVEELRHSGKLDEIRARYQVTGLRVEEP